MSNNTETITRLQNTWRGQHLPGLAIGIQKGDSLVHEAYYGYANLEHDILVSENTVFEIASVTKLFTAQTVMRLAQDGAIGLDDTLSTYLDNLPDAWKAVTIRHCLSHQSGIRSYTAVEAYWGQTRLEKSHGDILKLVRDLPLDFPSGTRYAYDNTGFYLLGMLIEAVSGKPYADVLREIIFEPMGMRNTQANDYACVIPHRAQGYIYKGTKVHHKDYYDISNTFSAGILLSTMRDLLAWRASLYNDAVLNAESRRLWWTVHPSQAGNERPNQFSVGLGWFMVDSPLGTFLGHNGGIAGFSSAFLHFREADVTGVALYNAGDVPNPHETLLAIVGEMGLLNL